MRWLYFFWMILIMAACDHPTHIKPKPVLPASVVNVSATITPDSATLAILLGKFNPSSHTDFVPVSSKYTQKSATMYLQKEAYTAFQQMYEAAKKEGINLTILSATRNFQAQKGIWEGKWTGTRKVENGEDLSKTCPDPVQRAKRILTFSSMPGSSRHHWGTDIDLVQLNNVYFQSGHGKKTYEWLVKHAASFGFCQPYSAGRAQGYHEEKWHWSYLPLAKVYTNLAAIAVKDQDFQGFKGAETALSIGIVQHYILGISADCLADIKEHDGH